jgi:hypothetical protein
LKPGSYLPISRHNGPVKPRRKYILTARFAGSS